MICVNWGFPKTAKKKKNNIQILEIQYQGLHCPDGLVVNINMTVIADY